MKQLTLTIFVLAILLFTGCRKDVPTGQLIQASGIVFDSVKNKKLANVIVYLYGAHQSFYGVTYGEGPFDSTMSDNNGNFSLKYYAKGNNVDYALAISNSVYGGIQCKRIM